MSWWKSLLDNLAWYFEKEFPPGTSEHREAFMKVTKEFNDERAKPPAQRDQARLLELSKRVLRLRIERCQFKQQQLLKKKDSWLQPRSAQEACCADCNRVRQRVAASCAAQAAWNAAWARVSTLRLQALEQGQPYPPLTLPQLELQLPDGLPAELPPSIDRCASCQQMLDRFLSLEQEVQLVVDVDP